MEGPRESLAGLRADAVAILLEGVGAADPAFLATRKHIEHLIHPPGAEAKESFPVLKFSAPDPDVV